MAHSLDCLRLGFDALAGAPARIRSGSRRVTAT